MNVIENALDPINSFLISMTRNTKEGWYEFEIGIPSNWVFEDNDDIMCEVKTQINEGKFIKILPKRYGVVADDLVRFVEIIIKTNERISAKEKEFTDKMEQMKAQLEMEAKKFYEELDDLKEKSFKQPQAPVKINLTEEKKTIKKEKVKSITGTTN